MYYGFRRVAIGAGTAIVFLLVFIAFVGVEDLINVIGSAQPSFILAALALSLTTKTIRGKMWHDNLKKVKNTQRYMRCVGAVYSSNFVNSFFAGGQLLTAYLLAKDRQSSPEDNFAAMVAQDILSWISAFVFIALGTTYYVMHNSGSALTPFLITGTLIAGAVIVASIIVVWKEESWLEHIAIFTGDIVYKLRSLVKGSSLRWKRLLEERMAVEVRQFEKALHLIFNSRLYVARVFLYSIMYRLCIVLTLYTILIALGVTVPLFVVFVVNSLSDLFNIMPLPGGIGGVEVGMTTLLIFLFSLSVPVAAGAVLLYRIFFYWTPLVLGGIALWILSGGHLFSQELYMRTQPAS